MLNVPPWLLMLASLLLPIVSSQADPLPSEFIGSWEAYVDGASQSPENSKLNCTEREGVTITSSRVDLNVESECGQIDNVRPNRFGNASVVNMTCFASEGRQRPLKYKDVQIWHLFKIEGNTFLAQTSVRNGNTDLYKKCDSQISRTANEVPYHLTIGYDNEDKTDASAQACLSHVKSVTAWDKDATEKGAEEVCAARKRHVNAYTVFQTNYRALVEAFSTDKRLKIPEAISNLRVMIKDCMNHKFSLTTGGHNIMMDIIENDIASDCLSLGSSLLKAEIKSYNAPR